MILYRLNICAKRIAINCIIYFLFLINYLKKSIQSLERFFKKILLSYQIAEIEEKITVMQAASATKCITCKPLLYKIFKTEGKLGQSTQEKTVQFQELHQIKWVFQYTSKKIVVCMCTNISTFNSLF